MDTGKLNPTELLKNYGFWMAIILSALVAINLTIFYRMNNIAHAGMSGLFWMAIYSLLWDRKKELKFQCQMLPTILGILLIGWTLFVSKSIPTEKENNLLSVAPFVFSVGLSFIAAGFYGLKQFRSELLIIFFLGVPRVILQLLLDLSPLTAKVSAFFLHYLGFNLVLDGIFIHLEKGSIKVYEGCSGIESVTYVLGLSVICLIMFPIKKKDQYIVPLVAIVTGFMVNAFRVVLMAILVGRGEKEAFLYWHEGEGSLIFGMIAVIVFGLFYWLLMNKTEKVATVSSYQEDDFFNSDQF
ncbi:MAG: cyanoexosortase A [Cyanobacteria bacterium]|nr:cyanoexosortase A [Cyanobacteria bacterium CG_2015-16_32_12]NCO77737.1 cyanoexosortase A [Cyanobacteria bacterium CG_2015-22_32_23]NCQ41713.1 cyanoexosortase A [Cyanobacteria bacterium CG_2015-04_32_10]NCS83585.1 cyanoexosortase A [Cyanobacteria bacterium CG_2015-02_32_10]